MPHETPMDRLQRVMKETANSARSGAATRRAGVHIQVGDGAMFVGGNVSMTPSASDWWLESRAEQARCRRLVEEIDEQLMEMSAAELRQTLDWIRKNVTAEGSP